MTDLLAGFEQSSFAAEGKARAVYRTGSGPAVIVMSEMPGITPKVARFGHIVADAGFTAVMPHLFGEDGRAPTVGYAVGSMARACIAREFTVLAQGRTSPIIRWLRALAVDEHGQVRRARGGRRGHVLHRGIRPGHDGRRRGGGPGAQPAVPPLPVTKARRRDLGLSPGDLSGCRSGPRPAAACSDSASPGTG